MIFLITWEREARFAQLLATMPNAATRTASDGTAFCIVRDNIPLPWPLSLFTIYLSSTGNQRLSLFTTWIMRKNKLKWPDLFAVFSENICVTCTKRFPITKFCLNLQRLASSG